MSDDVCVQVRFQIMIVTCAKVADRLSVNNDLRALLAGGFEQNGVEAVGGCPPARQCLNGLGAANFAAFCRHSAVQCHVLGFEGGDLVAASRQQATQRGDQSALAGIRGRALHHE